MITFPTSIMYAFSPQYVKITGETSAKNVTVTIGSNSIQAVVYNGEANILISRLIQLCFDSPLTERSKSVTISVAGDVTGSSTVLAVWGVLSSDYKYGQYANSNGVRTVHYFTAFPFSVDILTNSGFITLSPSGSTVYSYSSSFGTIKTIVKARTETEGIYLRWIDRFGFMQYYLFGTGDIEAKPTVSDYKILYEKALPVGGYDTFNRPLDVKTEKTIKLCGTSLDLSTIDYVSSIVASPIVDMYVDGVWIPVIVSSGTYSYSRHHLAQLQDFEFSVDLPTVKSQKL